MSIKVEFEPDVEAGIRSYMIKTGLSREEAINVLLDAGLSSESSDQPIMLTS